MDYIEVKAKTVDDAITDALVELGVTSDQLDYEIIDKGSAGFLGINRRDAVIRARKKVVVPEKPAEKAVEKQEPAVKKEKVPVKKPEQPAPVKPEVSVDFPVLEKEVQDFLKQVFAAMKLEVEIVTASDADNKVIEVEFKGPEMGMLIGKRGQTLDSLQCLSSLAGAPMSEG